MSAALRRLPPLFSLAALAAIGAGQEAKPLVTNYIGCYDTRDRENYGFRKKHWASSLEDVMFKCSMFRYVVLECPSEARAVFWCTNQLFPKTMKLEHSNCYGNPGSAKELNGGSNGLCSGPYWWPLLEGSVALGGWQRGAVYSVARDLGLLTEAPGRDVSLQEESLAVHEISEDGSYFYVGKREWQVYFGPLQSEDGVVQVVEQHRDGELVWTGSINVSLPGAPAPEAFTTTPTSTTTKAPAKSLRTKGNCSISFPVPKFAKLLPGLRKCHSMVLASAGSQANLSALREVGQWGKFISGKRPEWRAYRKNLFDLRAIGAPGTMRRCKDAEENISETVTFDFFPPGTYDLRIYNGPAREERNVTFLDVVQLSSDCRVKAGCGTKGNAGAGPNRACAFPFRYDGVLYTECTMQKASAKWCATETDANGHYISGRWGHCNDACMKEPEPESAEEEVPVTYSKVGAGVSCGTAAYKSSESPEACREWCTQREDCKAFVTFEDSPCDSCLAYTDNDCSLEFQKASSCTGQISAYKKIVRAERKKAITNEECTATFTYKNCKDGTDDRDITVSFTAAYEGYPLTYHVQYGAEGGDNSLGCLGSYRDADLQFTDAQGDSKAVTLVGNELAAAEVSNLRFSSNCPMKKAPVKESCSLTFFYRDCSSSAKSQDRTVTFFAYFVEETLGYSLEYSNEGGTNTDGCAGTFRDASLNLVDANDQEKTVVLVDNDGPAAEVSNFRFSKNCPMKFVTLPTVANVKPDWSKPLNSVMTALSSPMHSNGPIQNLLDASSNNYANFAGLDWSFPTWVVFDMHSTIQVAALEMKAANAVESPKLFAVSFGDDSTAGPWQPVDTFRIGAEWNGVKRWPFAGSYAGRFWKLSVLETFDGAAPTINYVRFYPPEGALNERPPMSSMAPKYNTVRVKMGPKSGEGGLQNLIVMDVLAFDQSGNQLQIMELHIFAEKNGADAMAPGTYTGGAAMEAITDGSHTTLGDGGWVNGERGRDPHIGFHGTTPVGTELFEIVADGDIVRLQVDFCRKNDAPALRFVRGDGVQSLSDAETGMEGVSEQVHFPPPPTTLEGHRFFNSEREQWKAGDQIRPPSLPTGWTYSFPSFATGLCGSKTLLVQRKVPSLVACEKNCADSTTCHFFAFSAGAMECRFFPACDLDRMNVTADYTTYKKKLSCSTAIATPSEAVLSLALPGTKTRHQCQAACSWQGSAFAEWRKDDDVTVCRCGLPGLSFHQVLIDRGTNRKPYDSHPEASACNDLDSWSHGWCLLEICPATEEATSETEFSAYGSGGHCKDGLLRKARAVPSISGCQKLCAREADCRYFSYNEGGTDTSEYGSCLRYSKCEEDALVMPGNTMFTTLAKSSQGRDKPPSWRLFTTSTFRRSAKQERNCWKISKLQFFASEDCSSLEFGIAPEKQIVSGVAQGFELSHVFGEDGTAAELRSADGDFGAREVWIGARELGGVRCIRFVQEPSTPSEAKQSGVGCRPLSNLEVQIGDFDGGSWKTVASVPWSVKMDGVNTFPNLDRAGAAVFTVDTSLAPPKTLTCVFQINDHLKSILYGGVDLMSLAGMGEGDSEKLRVVSFAVKPGAYLVITGEDAEGDFHDTGGFWADCGTVAPAWDLQNRWELYCSNSKIDVAHREGAGAGWVKPGPNSYKAKAKRIFGADKASIGSEAARYCSFRTLPKPAVSFKTLHSRGLFGQSELPVEEFNTRFRDAGTGILRRECQDCSDSHKKIYMRRKTKLDTWDAYGGIVSTWSEQGLHTDFDLYSTLQDALDDRNAWLRCDGVGKDVGFPGNCAPGEAGEAPSEPQWTSASPGEGRQNFKYAVYKVGERNVMNFAFHGDGLCSGVPLREVPGVESLEACQELCAEEEDCVYVSHGDPTTLSCMQFGGAACASLQFPACDAQSCGFQTFAKQRDDRVNCEFVLNDQIDSVFYGVNVTDLVTPTPGGSVVRRLGVVAKPGEYLIIAGQSKSGDMKFRGGFWADCGAALPPRRLDQLWDSFCSDTPIDEQHMRGGGIGWRPPMVRSTGQVNFPKTLGDDGMKYCAFRAVPAKIHPIWSNAWCKSATIFDNWPGAAGDFETAFACSSACALDERCRFFGYGKDPRTSFPRCAFFESCRDRRPYPHGDFHVYKAEEVRTELRCSFKPNAAGIQGIFYGAYLPQSESVHITIRPGSYLVFFGQELGRGFWADCGALAPRSTMQDAWESFCDASSLDTVHKMGAGSGWRTPRVSADDELIGYDGKEHCAFRLNPHALQFAPKAATQPPEPTYKKALRAGQRWLRGPAGEESDAAGGEGDYVSGEYEVHVDRSLDECQALCSDRDWCLGFNFKHTEDYQTLRDWKAGTCQLVSKLLATDTDVTSLDAYEKRAGVALVTTSTTTTTGQAYNFTLVGQGICSSMERISHHPDVGSRDACQEMCNRMDTCQAYSYCSDAEISGCIGFCGLYTGAVKYADNQNTSSCWAKTVCKSIVLDTPNATIEGEWTASRSVPGFVGRNYLLDKRAGGSVTWAMPAGTFLALLSYTPYPNRASNVPIVITQGGQSTTLRVNQKQGRQKLLGKYTFIKGDTIKLATYGVDGKVVADALRLLSCNGDLTSELEAPSEAPETEWKLVFRQTYPSLFKKGEWSLNSKNPASDNFAALDKLELYKIDGVFTFKLSWPKDGLVDQIWRQTSNPVTEESGRVDGYQAIEAPHAAFGWGGLRFGRAAALLDGSAMMAASHTNYAVGLTEASGSAIPGPGEPVQQVELYVQKFKDLEVPQEANRGAEVEELFGQCRMLPPLRADAPTAELVLESTEPWYDDCACLCSQTAGCRSLLYRESTGECFLLARPWKQDYMPPKTGDDVVAATKLCGEVQCPFRYFMLDVEKATDAEEAAWKLAELELRGRYGKVEIPPDASNVYLLDGRPRIARSLVARGTEALQVVDGDVTTSVVTDPFYSTLQDDSVVNGLRKDGASLAAKLILDLEGEHHVREVVMTSSLGGFGANNTKVSSKVGHPKTFAIRGSNDLASWTTLAKVSDLEALAKPGQVYVVPLVCPTPL